MLGAAGVTVKARPIQRHQLGVRFTDPELRRLEKEARDRGMKKSTLVQRLVLEWLGSLGQDGSE